MVDPLKTALAYLLSNADLNTSVAGRIAAKSKFAMDGATASPWTVGQRALTVGLVAATPDVYTGTIPFRLVLRCWGVDQQEAMAVWQEVARLVNATERTVVTLDSGDALLYYLVPEGTAEFGYDPDIKMDFVYVVLRGAVHIDHVA